MRRKVSWKVSILAVGSGVLFQSDNPLPEGDVVVGERVDVALQSQLLVTEVADALKGAIVEGGESDAFAFGVAEPVGETVDFIPARVGELLEFALLLQRGVR